MFIMLADFSGEGYSLKEKRNMELKRKWSILDSIQLNRIKFKMKFIYHKIGGKKYIVFVKIRKNVLVWLKSNEYKVRRYTKPTGEFYYYIYF